MQNDSLFHGSIVARFAHFITIAPLHKLPLMLVLFEKTITQEKKQKLVALLLFVLGSTNLFSLVRELIVNNSATVFVKHGNDVTFHGNDLWIGVVTNGSLSLGFLLMGFFMLLATNGSKLEHLPMVCLGVSLTSMFNFFVFYIFVV